MLEDRTNEASREAPAAPDEAAGTVCCSPAERATCCEPADKAACCGDGGASCACR